MDESRKSRARTLLKAKSGVAGLGLVAAVSMTACNLVISHVYTEDADLSAPRDMAKPGDQAQSLPDQNAAPADLASMPDKI